MNSTVREWLKYAILHRVTQAHMPELMKKRILLTNGFSFALLLYPGLLALVSYLFNVPEVAPYFLAFTIIPALVLFTNHYNHVIARLILLGLTPVYMIIMTILANQQFIESGIDIGILNVHLLKPFIPLTIVGTLMIVDFKNERVLFFPLIIYQLATVILFHQFLAIGIPVDDLPYEKAGWVLYQGILLASIIVLIFLVLFLMFINMNFETNIVDQHSEL